MDVARDRADLFGDRRRKRDHVVTGDGLVVIHALRIHSPALQKSVAGFLELSPILGGMIFARAISSQTAISTLSQTW